MNSGMFAALSAGLMAETRMDRISNNLANVNTPGFKRDRTGFESLMAGNTNQVPQSTTADPIMQKENLFIDYTPGSIAQTGNTLDLAIDGNGFFAVQTPGGLAYTRQGNFTVSRDGVLMTSDGYPVQGGQGNVANLKGSQIEIDGNGKIIVDGAETGAIKLVDFPKPYNLKKVGSALFVPENSGAEPIASTAQIRQGHLEGSNVETVSEMVQMIQATRDYESYSKVIKGFDDMTNKTVNELGRL